jgi:hypothetical protein
MIVIHSFQPMEVATLLNLLSIYPLLFLNTTKRGIICIFLGIITSTYHAYKSCYISYHLMS